MEITLPGKEEGDPVAFPPLNPPFWGFPSHLSRAASNASLLLRYPKVITPFDSIVNS